MKLGLFGGTFDPVHLGHLLLAERVREQLELDEVRFLPAAASPFKQDGATAEGKARAEMLEFAVAGHPHFSVDRRELQRGGVSYTVDTLAEIAAERPEAELFFLMGADSLRDFPAWREPERIASLATLAVANRGETPPIVPPGLDARVIPVPMPPVDLSATALRARVRDGRSIRYCVPAAVGAYIAQHELYSIS